MTPMDPALLTTLILVVGALAWLFAQIRSLNQRLASLEKQHLALVEQLEERLYSGQP